MLSFIWAIWKIRCTCRFDGRRENLRKFYSSMQADAMFALQRKDFKSELEEEHKPIFHFFGFQFNVRRTVPFKWCPPVAGLFLNVDGASRGEPVSFSRRWLHHHDGILLLGFAYYYDSQVLVDLINSKGDPRWTLLPRWPAILELATAVNCPIVHTRGLPCIPCCGNALSFSELPIAARETLLMLWPNCSAARTR